MTQTDDSGPEIDFVLAEARKWLEIQPVGFTAELVRKLITGYESLASQLTTARAELVTERRLVRLLYKAYNQSDGPSLDDIEKQEEFENGQNESPSGPRQARFGLADSKGG